MRDGKWAKGKSEKRKAKSKKQKAKSKKEKGKRKKGRCRTTGTTGDHKDYGDLFGIEKPQAPAFFNP
jgi:hypothetical protein